MPVIAKRNDEAISAYEKKREMIKAWKIENKQVQV
jgi:hypothetical protein